MIDISVSHMNKYFGDTPILLDIDFEIYEGRRVGLIGKNGSGKTTLFRCITGEYDIDDGDIVIPQSKKLGILTQIPIYPEGSTVEDVMKTAFVRLDEMKHEIDEIAKRLETSHDDADVRRYGELSTAFELAGGYTTDVELARVAAGLAIDQTMMRREFALLSGGEQTRVNLARMILEHTDIMLLDEPTNHLDIKSVEWLESFLASYKGTAVVISHDRYFLDQTVNMIIEIENLHATVYDGNYSFYADAKQERLELQQRQYEAEQREVKRLEFTADRMRGWGMGNKRMMRKAMALERRIERIQKTERVRNDKKLKSEFKEASRSGNDVCYIRELAKAFDGKQLFHDLSFDIKKDESVALIGDNGTGKTTLLKILLGEEEPDDGRVRWGANVRLAYLPQLVKFANEYNTVSEEVCDALKITPNQARSRLAQYHFVGDDLGKLVGELSGGEKSRLRLCILMYNEINLLILDEPTNHLDIPSREWMEDALESYDGTLLFVSHDRYFVNRFATRVIELTGGGGVRDYTGTYEEYREYVARMELREQNELEAARERERAERERAKQEQKVTVAQNPKNSKAMERKRAVLEREIDAKEKSYAEYDEKMAAVATDHEALTALIAEKEALRAEIDGLYEQWEAMS